MAKKHRLGSDPFSQEAPKKSQNTGRKGSDDADTTPRGIDSLIQDTTDDTSLEQGYSQDRVSSEGLVSPSQQDSRSAPTSQPKPPQQTMSPLDKEPSTGPAEVQEGSGKPEELLSAIHKTQDTESVSLAEGKRKEKPPETSGDQTTIPRNENQTKADFFHRGDTEQANTVQYLSFKLNEETFAFEIDTIREVLTFDAVTKVPQTPDFMRGVINLRGSVVSVVDLKLLFGMSETQKAIDTCIIIVEVDMEGEKTPMGALADSVVEVFEIPADALQPAPRIGTHLKTEFLKGMGKRADESFVLILDSERIFSAEEFLDKITNWSR